MAVNVNKPGKPKATKNMCLRSSWVPSNYKNNRENKGGYKKIIRIKSCKIKSYYLGSDQ